MARLARGSSLGTCLVTASMAEQAAALVRAGYFADAASMMRTVIGLLEGPPGEGDVVPIGTVGRRPQ